MMQINDPYAFGVDLGRFIFQINARLDHKGLVRATHAFISTMDTDINLDDNEARDNLMMGVGAGYELQQHVE